MRKLSVVMSLMLSTLALTGCMEYMKTSSQSAVNTTTDSYNYHYAYEQSLPGDASLNPYQYEHARLERQAQENRMALQRARNSAERAQLENQLREQEANIAEARSKMDAARIRAQRAESAQRAAENAQRSAEISQQQAQRELTIQKENNTAAEAAKRRAIEAQISADRALAERLQAEENARFQQRPIQQQPIQPQVIQQQPQASAPIMPIAPVTAPAAPAAPAAPLVSAPGS